MTDPDVRTRTPAHARSGAGRAVRSVVLVLAAACAAILVAVLLAGALLRVSGGLQQALSAVDSARPWFIALQIIVLVLLWQVWPQIVSLLNWLRPMSPRAQQALVKGRPRIFAMLAICELLIVLRAFAA